MELVEAERLDVVQTQAVFRYAKLAQGQVLGHGEVIAITGPCPQKLLRRRPVIGRSPDAEVIGEVETIEEIVHFAQLTPDRRALQTLQQLLPLLHTIPATCPVDLDELAGIHRLCQTRTERKRQQHPDRKTLPPAAMIHVEAP